MGKPLRLIADGRTEEAVGFLLNKLEGYSSSSVADNLNLSRFDLEIISISGWLEFINAAKRSGVIDLGEYIIQRNKLNQSLVFLLKDYSEPN